MLKSEHLKLRALKIEDLKYLNEWRNDLENKIMAQGYRLPITMLQDENWLKSKMGNTHANEVFFIIETIEEGIPIGLIQLTDIDYISGIAIWGIVLGDKSMRGRGFSKEASLLLFDYAFNVLNLRKIFGYPIAYNKETLKMHKSLGFFHEEGRLKSHYYLNGDYHDVFILSVFREDFTNLYPDKK